MKNITKFLCATLCIIMMLTAVACTSGNTTADTTAADVTGDVTADVTGDVTTAADEDVVTVPTAVASSSYEMNVLFGSSQFIAIHDKNENGNIVKSRLMSMNNFGIEYVYVDHVYNNKGILDKSVLYIIEEGNDMYKFNYTELGTVQWTADESGKVVSGAAVDSTEAFPTNYKIEYHANGVPSKVEMFDIEEESFIIEYDESGKKVREYFSEGGIEATFTYTDDLITSMNVKGEGEEESAVMTAKFDDKKRIVELNILTGEDGEVVVGYTYLENSDKIDVFTMSNVSAEQSNYSMSVDIGYNEKGYINSIVNKQQYGEEEYNYAIAVEFDDKDNVIKHTQSDLDGDKEVQRREELNEYDANGNVTKNIYTRYIMNEEGTELVLESRDINTYKYNAKNECVEEIIESYDADNVLDRKYVVRYEYDDRGNTTKEEYESYDSDGIITLKEITEQEYNDKDQCIKRTVYSYDGETLFTGKRVDEYEYYDNEKIKKETSTEYNGNDVAVSQVINEYYENGNSASITEANFDESGVKTGYTVYKFTYNDADLLVKEEITTYDADGNVVSKKITEKEYNENGDETKETQSEYDADNKLQSKYVYEYIYEGSELVKVIRTTYDGEGNVIDVVEEDW